MDKLYVEIGGRIRALRKALRLTQAQVAEKAGIDASFYGQLERGTNIPSLKTLLSVAAALHADARDLLPSGSDKKDGPAYHTVVDNLLSGLKPAKKRFVLGVVHDIVNEIKK